MTIKSLGFGWNAPTHQTITEQAFLNVQKESKNHKTTDLAEKMAKFDLPKLKDFSVKPDIDEPGLFGKTFSNNCHFYDTRTKRNYILTKDTAKKRFIDHSTEAANQFKKGNITEATKHLGRACHFLGDLGMSWHTHTPTVINAKLRLKSHEAFEEVASNKLPEILPRLPKFETEARTLTPAGQFVSFITDLAEKTAKESSADWSIAKKEKTWGQAAEVGIQKSVKVMTKFLSTFFRHL